MRVCWGMPFTYSRRIFNFSGTKAVGTFGYVRFDFFEFLSSRTGVPFFSTKCGSTARHVRAYGPARHALTLVPTAVRPFIGQSVGYGRTR